MCFCNVVCICVFRFRCNFCCMYAWMCMLPTCKKCECEISLAIAEPVKLATEQQRRGYIYIDLWNLFLWVASFQEVHLWGLKSLSKRVFYGTSKVQVAGVVFFWCVSSHLRRNCPEALRRFEQQGTQGIRGKDSSFGRLWRYEGHHVWDLVVPCWVGDSC